MRKLVHIYKNLNYTLRIWESENKLRGELFDNNTNERISFADFYEKDGDKDEFRVREYFGFNNFYEVPFERKNGKIVYYPNVNVHRRVIWTNNDYDEWKENMLLDDAEADVSYDRYCEDCEICLDDERCNLNKEVDGCIIGYANLGFWNGRCAGVKVLGTNIKDILSSNCDYVTWYCDLHNVRCEAIHHDGTNYILYRVAESREKAERIAERLLDKGMSEEQFRKATKSLRPYVADVYGW
jgi:hypothetical protein